MREMRDALKELGVSGQMSETDIEAVMASGKVRSLQRESVGVAAAATEALKRMQRTGAVEFVKTTRGRRKPWGAWGVEGKGPEAVEHRMRRWIREATLDQAAPRRVTVRNAYDQYKRQHLKAGGNPTRLREQAKHELRELAMDGRLLQRPRRSGSGAGTLLNLFSGGQSAQAAGEATGHSTVHIDVMTEYPLDKDRRVRVRTSTDLSQAPHGRMIPWLEKREGLLREDTTVVAASLPCHTWTPLDATNRPTHGRYDRSYRTKNGTPNEADSERAAEARRQDALAANTIDSILDWVAEGAYRGEQRYYWIENPYRSTLRTRPPEFMSRLPNPKMASYCMYRSHLGARELYKAEKSTAIWTNIARWTPRRCEHQGHASKIGASSQQRLEISGLSKWAAKRWIPEELILTLLQAVATREVP